MPSPRSPRRHRYVAFLSHFKEQAAAEARLLKTALQSQSGINVFLDSDNLMDLRSLLKAVRQSEYLLLLMTRDVLTRPWVLRELHEVHCQGVKFACVIMQGLPRDRAYSDEDDATLFGPVEIARAALEQRNLGCVSELEQSGIVVDDVLKSICTLLPNAVHLHYNVRESQRVQAAQVGNILEFLNRAPQRLSVCTAPRTICLSSGKRYIAFLAYCEEAAKEMPLLKSKLEERGGGPVFADVSGGGLRREELELSVALVLVQTRSILLEPFVLLQCEYALKIGLPILALNLQGKSYDFSLAEPFLSDLRASLSLPSEKGGRHQTLDILERENVDIDELSWRLACSLPYVISRTVDCSNDVSARIFTGQVDDLLENISSAEAFDEAMPRDVFTRVQSIKPNSREAFEIANIANGTSSRSLQSTLYHCTIHSTTRCRVSCLLCLLALIIFLYTIVDFDAKPQDPTQLSLSTTSTTTTSLHRFEPLPVVEGLVLDLRGNLFNAGDDTWINQVERCPIGRCPNATVPDTVSYDSEELAFSFKKTSDVITVPISTGYRNMLTVTYAGWVKCLSDLGKMAAWEDDYPRICDASCASIHYGHCYGTCHWDATLKCCSHPVRGWIFSQQPSYDPDSDTYNHPEFQISDKCRSLGARRTRAVAIFDQRFGGASVTPDVGSLHVSSLGPAPLDKWFHVVGVFDHEYSATCTTYLDNASDIQECHESCAAFRGRSIAFAIGGKESHSRYYNTKCLVSDVSVYNRALQPAEVARLFDFGRPSNPRERDVEKKL